MGGGGERSLVNGQFPHPAPGGGGGVGLIIDRCIIRQHPPAPEEKELRMRSIFSKVEEVTDEGPLWSETFELTFFPTTFKSALLIIITINGRT